MNDQRQQPATRLPEKSIRYEHYARVVPKGKLAETIRWIQQLCPPLHLACSGGADSVFSCECARLSGLPFEVYHVNHHLRDSADADAEFCRSLSAYWDVPFHLLDAEVSTSDGSMEAAAREARYQVLLHAMGSRPGTLITGHSASDQLETHIMRLGRGTGLAGWQGIRRTMDMEERAIARPVLSFWRDEIRDILQRVGMPWVDDPTNFSQEMLRNRVRDRMTPAIHEEFSSSALLGSLENAESEVALYQAWISQLASSCNARVFDGEYSVKAQALSDAVPSITEEHRQTAIRAILRELFVRSDIPYDRRILQHIAGWLDNGGMEPAITAHRVRVEYDEGAVTARRTSSPSRPFSVGVPVDARTPVSFKLPPVHTEFAIGGRRLQVRLLPVDAIDSQDWMRDGYEYFDADCLSPPLYFRQLRRSDEWVRPDRERRNLWKRAKRDGRSEQWRRAAVVFANDTDVYWLVGGRRSSLAMIDNNTQQVLEIRCSD